MGCRSRRGDLGDLGRFLHEYSPTKGFFDLADIAWLIDRSVCQEEVVPAPRLQRFCHFDHGQAHGSMRRVYAIQAEPTWELFFHYMARAGLWA